MGQHIGRRCPILGEKGTTNNIDCTFETQLIETIFTPEFGMGGRGAESQTPALGLKFDVIHVTITPHRRSFLVHISVDKSKNVSTSE